MSEERWPVRVVVGALALVFVVGALGMIVLAFMGKAIPDQLDRLTTFAGGGLVGMLAKTTRGPQPGDEAVPVQVVAEASPMPEPGQLAQPDAEPVVAAAERPLRAR